MMVKAVERKIIQERSLDTMAEREGNFAGRTDKPTYQGMGYCDVECLSDDESFSGWDERTFLNLSICLSV